MVRDSFVPDSRRMVILTTKVWFGSGQVSSLFKSNAGKQSLKFRFPDAAIRHLVLATLCGRSYYWIAVTQNVELTRRPSGRSG